MTSPPSDRRRSPTAASGSGVLAPSQRASGESGPGERADSLAGAGPSARAAAPEPYSVCSDPDLSLAPVPMPPVRLAKADVEQEEAEEKTVRMQAKVAA